MGEQILGLMVYCIPALVTGVIAFLFFREHTDNENNRRNFILKESIQKELEMKLDYLSDFENPRPPELAHIRQLADRAPD